MKFLILFIVTFLAMTTYGYNTRNVRNIHSDQGLKAADEFFPANYQVAFEHFMEGFELLFPQQFADFIRKFFEAFQKTAEYFPNEVKTAFANVWKYCPSFKDFFSEEFFSAFAEFFRAFSQFFVPHQFHSFVNKTLNAFPNFTEALPADFYPIFAKHLETVPFAKSFIQQWIVFLERFVPHATHNA